MFFFAIRTPASTKCKLQTTFVDNRILPRFVQLDSGLAATELQKGILPSYHHHGQITHKQEHEGNYEAAMKKYSASFNRSVSQSAFHVISWVLKMLSRGTWK